MKVDVYSTKFIKGCQGVSRGVTPMTPYDELGDLQGKSGGKRGCNKHPFDTFLLWSVIKGCFGKFARRHPLMIRGKTRF